MHVTLLECSATGERYSADELQGLSSAGKPLLVRYDLAAAARTVTRESLSAREPDMWKWSEFRGSAQDERFCLITTEPKSPRMETTHLGKASTLPASPDEAVLDYVPNPRPGALYLVRFAAPEFTSLCPVTGQPDFAHLVIDYAPAETIVESKSLKLFLGSFRSHCGYHEDVTVGIGQRLNEEMKPKWLRIGGYWYPRGGMPIDVFWQSGPPPEGLWVPGQGVAAYRGRG